MKNKQPINYGGQAVIEGVMMRGKKRFAVAVRAPNGKIVVHSEPLNSTIYGSRIAQIPFVRGITLLWDALGLGTKSLMFAAEIAEQEETETAASETPTNSLEETTNEAAKIFADPTQWSIVALSLAMSLSLFFVLPAFLAGQIEAYFLPNATSILSNLVEGAIRLTFVIGYIWGIGFMPEIKRLYGYHGAEHKTINAFEAGAPLTPQSISQFPIEHPRCGTAFLLTVVLISIIFFSLFPKMSILVRVMTRILLIPIVSGIAYEFLRFTAKYQHITLIRWITLPNLALQRLTTNEPDHQMIEVAVAAFQEVLE